MGAKKTTNKLVLSALLPLHITLGSVERGYMKNAFAFKCYTCSTIHMSINVKLNTSMCVAGQTAAAEWTKGQDERW